MQGASMKSFRLTFVADRGGVAQHFQTHSEGISQQSFGLARRGAAAAQQEAYQGQSSKRNKGRKRQALAPRASRACGLATCAQARKRSLLCVTAHREAR